MVFFFFFFCPNGGSVGWFVCGCVCVSNGSFVFFGIICLGVFDFFFFLFLVLIFFFFYCARLFWFLLFCFLLFCFLLFCFLLFELV